MQDIVVRTVCVSLRKCEFPNVYQGTRRKHMKYNVALNNKYSSWKLLFSQNNQKDLLPIYLNFTWR